MDWTISPIAKAGFIVTCYEQSNFSSDTVGFHAFTGLALVIPFTPSPTPIVQSDTAFCVSR